MRRASWSLGETPAASSSRSSGVFSAEEGGTWVSSAMSDGDRVLAKEPDLSGPGDLQLRFVVVDPDTYERFFDRVANGVLWRIHHSMSETGPVSSERSRDDWEAFEATNRAFADVLDEAPRDAVFLVQDYQLPLVPRYLRELRPDARIVHFTHTPFGGPDAWRSAPPWIREGVLRGMCASDVLGFQSRTWATNFLATVRAHTDANVDIRAGRLSTDGHEVRVRTLPRLRGRRSTARSGDGSGGGGRPAQHRTHADRPTVDPARGSPRAVEEHPSGIPGVRTGAAALPVVAGARPIPRAARHRRDRNAISMAGMATRAARRSNASTPGSGPKAGGLSRCARARTPPRRWRRTGATT